MNSKEKMVIVIAGPTAVGKTKVATWLAKKLDLEIINADSRQVYKKLNIGTAKPLVSEMEGVKFYFVDELDLSESFSAGIFERRSMEIAEKVFQKSDALILSGGSGLYIDAFINGLDPLPEVPIKIREDLIKEKEIAGIDSLVIELKESDPEYYHTVDVNNPQRIIRALEIIRFTGKPFSEFRKGRRSYRPFKTLKIALDLPREELYDKIESRMDSMIQQGLFNEAESLISWKGHNALQTVGYQEIYPFLAGEYDENEAVRLLKRNSRRYAKRQLTWIRRDSEYQWFHPDDLEAILGYINSNLNT